MRGYPVRVSTELPPSISKRALGDMLKRLRTDSGLSRGRVGDHVGKIEETVRRWEVGQVAPNVSIIRDLANLYGASPEELARMTSLAASSKERGLYEDAGVPPDLRYLYESEATSRAIRSVELENIPGLLQTPEYHRCLQEAQLAEPAEFESAIRDLRPRRQELVFGRRKPPHLQWAIGQSALAYLKAEPDIREGQLKRLREVNEVPGAEIRIINRFHPAMLGAFTLITPSAAANHPFVYVEGLDGGRYLEHRDVVSRYEAAFAAVFDSAIPLEEYLR